MISIRTGQLSDLDTLILMWQLIDDHVIKEIQNIYLKERVINYSSELESTIREMLDGNDVTILVAEKDENIVGFITAYIEKLPWFTPSTGLLGSCWVNEKERNNGIGGQLVNHAEVWLQERKVFNIQVCWDNGNKVADAFWAKNGYSISQFRGVKSCEY